MNRILTIAITAIALFAVIFVATKVNKSSDKVSIDVTTMYQSRIDSLQSLYDQLKLEAVSPSLVGYIDITSYENLVAELAKCENRKSAAAIRYIAMPQKAVPPTTVTTDTTIIRFYDNIIDTMYSVQQHLIADNQELRDTNSALRVREMLNQAYKVYTGQLSKEEGIIGYNVSTSGTIQAVDAWLVDYVTPEPTTPIATKSKVNNYFGVNAGATIMDVAPIIGVDYLRLGERNVGISAGALLQNNIQPFVTLKYGWTF